MKVSSTLLAVNEMIRHISVTELELLRDTVTARLLEIRDCAGPPTPTCELCSRPAYSAWEQGTQVEGPFHSFAVLCYEHGMELCHLTTELISRYPAGEINELEEQGCFFCNSDRDTKPQFTLQLSKSVLEGGDRETYLVVGERRLTKWLCSVHDPIWTEFVASFKQRILQSKQAASSD